MSNVTWTRYNYKLCITVETSLKDYPQTRQDKSVKNATEKNRTRTGKQNVERNPRSSRQHPPMNINKKVFSSLVIEDP